MKRNTPFIPLAFLIAFVIWTILLGYVDVQAIGPMDSAVGFATVNQWFHTLTDVHMVLYTITDWLGLVPIAFAFGFAILGLVQWITRKHLFKVDGSLFVLGGFYIVVIAAYILFEYLVINYRPVLINGYLETSYPSSTTLLVLCVMPTAIMQFNSRIRNALLRRCVHTILATFTVFMVMARLISGVHWISDIIGGMLLSVGLVWLYHYVMHIQTKKDTRL